MEEAFSFLFALKMRSHLSARRSTTDSTKMHFNKAYIEIMAADA
jgi:hypothetical protein